VKNQRELRDLFLAGLERVTNHLISIADGSVLFKDGDKMRPPTPSEQLRAIETLAKYSIGGRQDTTRDEQPQKAYIFFDRDQVCELERKPEPILDE
jgi:hypothetical protein